MSSKIHQTIISNVNRCRFGSASADIYDQLIIIRPGIFNLREQITRVSLAVFRTRVGHHLRCQKFISNKSKISETSPNIFPYHVLLEYVRIPINVVERDETPVVMARAIFVVYSQRVILVVDLHFPHRNFIRDTANRAPYVPVLQISWLYFSRILLQLDNCTIHGWTRFGRKDIAHPPRRRILEQRRPKCPLDSVSWSLG